MKKKVELSNLLTSEKSKENLLELKYEITCEDTFIFLDKLKEIMSVVLDSSNFEKQLPEWFKNKFSVERTEKEKVEWLLRWQSLSEEQKTAESKRQQWTLGNWTYWMEEDNRTWYWYDTLENAFSVELTVLVESYPTALESLEKLLECCGAKKSEIINQ